MSVNGINNTPLLPNTGSLSRSDSARTNGAQHGAERAQQATTNARAANTAVLKPQTPIAGQSTQSTVPAEAPAGTDPIAVRARPVRFTPSRKPHAARTSS